MASKEKYLNETQKKLVIDLVKQGKSYRKVQEVTNIIFTTVGTIVKKYRLYDLFEICTGRGRKPKSIPRDNREMLGIVKINQFESTKKIANNLKNLTGTTISLTLIRNCIHKTGFSGYVAHKKPLINKPTHKKSYEETTEFCKKSIDDATIFLEISSLV